MKRANTVSSNSLRNSPIKTFVWALMVASFFEPMCFQYLENAFAYQSLVRILDVLWTVIRLAVSAYSIMYIAKKVDISRDIYFIIAMFFYILSPIVNAQFGFVINDIARAFMFLGLIAFLNVLIQESLERTINSLCLVFSIYAIISVYTVIAFPYGMNSGSNIYDAIYFFGGKNSIFLTFLPCIVCFLLRSYYKKGALDLLTIGITILSITLSLKVGSTSSTFCFTVLLFFLVIVYLKKKVWIATNAYLWFAIIAILFFTVVCFQSISLLRDTGIFDLLNRSDTFSGRSVLWPQAIEVTLSNPLFGTGSDYVYYLSPYRITGHPHSFFLEYSSRYGLLFILFFVIDIIRICHVVSNSNNSVLKDALVICFFILLGHSLFDVMSIYVYLLIREILLLSSNCCLQISKNT